MQQFGRQLLYWNAEGCASYVCHISFKSTHLHIIVSGILIERDCFKMFELLRIWLISQHLAAHFSHCKAIIDNMVLNSGLYFIDMRLCPRPLSSASSSVLPVYPSTMILSPHLPLLPLVCWPWSFSGCSSTVRICNSCVVLSICFLIEGLWMSFELFQRFDL